MRDIIPIADREQRMPEGGRIRLGVYKGNRPQSIDTFRFTSPDVEAIQQLAEVYGGIAQPWSRGHGSQWEVITDANEVRIVLPPDPLSQHYELWSGGGCQRRCDGETAEVPGRDGMDTTRCICRSKGETECSPKTRLNVILPDIKFGGVWRLETSSWYAMDELKGFVDTIRSLQERGGLTVGLLALEQRQSKKNGKTKNYVVPTLRLSASVEDVLSGAAHVNRLAGPTSVEARPVLDAPSPRVEDSPEGGAGPPSGGSPPAPTQEPVAPEEDGEASEGRGRGKVDRGRLNRKLHAMFNEYGWDYESQVRPALESSYEGRTLSKLTDKECQTLVKALRDPKSRARFEEHMPYIVEDAEVVS